MNTSITIRLAYTTALRTSSEACKHHAKHRQRWSRRAVLTQPAHDVFDVDDRIVDHFAHRDHQPGEDHRVDRRSPVDAARASRRSSDKRDRRQADQRASASRTGTRRRITTTSTQPTAWLADRLSSDRSMNVAGRKIVGSISTSFRPGCRASRAVSTVAGDVQRVAGRLLLDDQQQAPVRR